MTPDFINGLFEFAGGVFILNHARVLYGHKQVRGVSILSTAFFFAWGLWNLFYYPHLDQLWSLAGGCVIVAANSVWVAMLLYYSWRERSGYTWDAAGYYWSPFKGLLP